MRKYVGMTLTYRIDVEEIEAEQDPGSDFIDVPEVVFKWKIGWHGVERSVTPTRISQGRYEVSVTPDRSGTLYWRWDTEGETDAVKESFDIILESAFETARARDYV